MHRASHYPSLSRIKIGEPDANSEFFSALRTNSTPIFLDCFLSTPHFPSSEFLTGEKYIVYGQKGTGKTSILRHLDRQLRQTVFASEFIIFKKTFLEEMDLTDYARLPLKVDEDEIKRLKHFHHTVKRLLIVIMLSRILSGALDADVDHTQPETRGFLQKISKSSVGDAIKLGLDSIASIFQSMDLDISKISNEKLLIDGGRLLKRNNDDLLGFLIRRLK
jgi:hypothetical protein